MFGALNNKSEISPYKKVISNGKEFKRYQQMSRP